MKGEILEILKVIHLAEGLKREKRHSWLSNGDQESVAEHTWRLLLLILTMAPQLEKPVNLKKALTMAIIHDLPEVKVGDKPDFETVSEDHKNQKHLLEKRAMKEITERLGRPDLYEIWEEFEKKETLEAKFVQALDRLELQIQHNEAETSTWLDIEKKRMYLGLESYCLHDQALLELAKLCKRESRDKIRDEDKRVISKWMEGKSLSECLKLVGIKGEACGGEHEQ